MMDDASNGGELAPIAGSALTRERMCAAADGAPDRGVLWLSDAGRGGEITYLLDWAHPSLS